MRKGHVVLNDPVEPVLLEAEEVGQPRLYAEQVQKIFYTDGARVGEPLPQHGDLLLSASFHRRQHLRVEDLSTGDAQVRQDGCRIAGAEGGTALAQEAVHELPSRRLAQAAVDHHEAPGVQVFVIAQPQHRRSSRDGLRLRHLAPEQSQTGVDVGDRFVEMILTETFLVRQAASKLHVGVVVRAEDVGLDDGGVLEP